jgi:sorbitol-specific phosphotransferase system component IIBC
MTLLNIRREKLPGSGQRPCCISGREIMGTRTMTMHNNRRGKLSGQWQCFISGRENVRTGKRYLVPNIRREKLSESRGENCQDQEKDHAKGQEGKIVRIRREKMLATTTGKVVRIMHTCQHRAVILRQTICFLSYVWTLMKIISSYWKHDFATSKDFDTVFLVQEFVSL